jgi:hypothetical protein
MTDLARVRVGRVLRAANGKRYVIKSVRKEPNMRSVNDEIEQLEKQADGLQKLLEESLGGRGFDDEFDKKKPAEGSQEEEDAETADEEAAEQVKKQLDDMQAELASLGADLGKALIEAPQTAWNTRVAKVARDQEADHFGTRVSSTPAASKR